MRLRSPEPASYRIAARRSQEVAPLKSRTPALILLVVSLALALYTGWHLKQALDVAHDLQAQMSDLSLVNMTDASASANAVSLGENSLKGALDEVRKTTHRDEAFLAVEAVGVLLGLMLLRRPAATS